MGFWLLWEGKLYRKNKTDTQRGKDQSQYMQKVGLQSPHVHQRKIEDPRKGVYRPTCKKRLSPLQNGSATQQPPN